MKSLDPIVLRLHQASLQPDIWPDVIHELSDVFDGRPLMYGVQWLPSGMSFMKSAHLPSDIIQQITSQYAGISTNPVVRAAVPVLKLHEPISLDSMMSPEELRKTDYYKKTIAKMGGIIGDIVVASHVAPTRITALVLARTTDQAPAGGEEIETLTRLSPHLGLAMEVMVRMGRLSAAYHALDQVLCRVAQPVVLVDSAGTILFANPALEDLVASSEVLEVRAGRLHSKAGEHDARLQQFIAALAGPDLSERDERSFRIEATFERPAIELVGQPIRSEFAANLDLGETRAIVFVSNLGSMRTDLGEALSRYFKLSPRQAAVVGLILDGLPGPAVAEALNISMNTLKTHMQRIYEKTQTRSREELFKRLISVAAQTPRLDP